jgi:hypothetical protein
MEILQRMRVIAYRVATANNTLHWTPRFLGSKLCYGTIEITDLKHLSCKLYYQQLLLK